MLHKVKAATDTLKELFAYYFAVVLTGAVIFSFAEGKSLWDSIWWAGGTATTIGYGDIAPATVIGRIAGLAMTHIVLLLILPLIIARIASQLIENHNEFTHDEQTEILERLRNIEERLN